MNKKRLLTVIGGKKDQVASIGVTTAGAETLTIAALTVSAGNTLVVDWGDGSSSELTGAGARTHDYAGAGTFTVTFKQPQYITDLTVTDTKAIINSSTLKTMTNISDFRVSGGKGSFYSIDVKDWRPTIFQLLNMNAAYTGLFSSADISAWRPTDVRIYDMDMAGFSFNMTAGSFAGWITTTYFRFSGNGFVTEVVDNILKDFWDGFATRTGAAGTISIAGTNQAPSGIYQAANPPTTGLEYRYELLNDSQNINPTKKWATVTVTA